MWNIRFGGSCKNLMKKQEGNRQLGRPRRKWEDNIEMGRQELGWRRVDRSGLGQGKVAGCCEYGNEHSGSK